MQKKFAQFKYSGIFRSSAETLIGEKPMTKSIQEISNKALVIRKACMARYIKETANPTQADLDVFSDLKAEFDKRLKERNAK